MSATSLSGQYKWEIGPFLGLSNYMGDLVPVPFSIINTKPALGALVRYNYSGHISLRGAVSYGQLIGDDKNSSDRYRYRRNLSFKSNILDLGLLIEASLLKFNMDRRGHRLTPYVLAGISAFHFNPKAFYAGQWHELQPLGTEGQGIPGYLQVAPYALWQMSIPFGGGLKFNLSRNWNICLESRWHKTFTDYLDDVSSTYPDPDLIRQHRGAVAAALSNRTPEVVPFAGPSTGLNRGNDQQKDMFIFTGFSLTYIIRKSDCYRY
ncbi:MAG: DUF6089 family protein [Bacteroidota bacterium]|nr:DUF6089 family protein [Bacteroidota bacterium]